jgi:hypothetical protein
LRAERRKPIPCPIAGITYRGRHATGRTIAALGFRALLGALVLLLLLIF